MARKTSQMPTLQERANVTASLIYAGRAALRNLLLDGADTATVRSELAELERDATRFAGLIEQEDSARQAAHDDALFAAVDALVSGATGRINAVLASLAPPAAPWAVS